MNGYNHSIKHARMVKQNAQNAQDQSKFKKAYDELYILYEENQQALNELKTKRDSKLVGTIVITAILIVVRIVLKKKDNAQ